MRGGKKWRTENDQELYETAFVRNAMPPADHWHYAIGSSSSAIGFDGVLRTRCAAVCGRVATTGGTYRALPRCPGGADSWRFDLSRSSCCRCQLASAKQLSPRLGSDESR